MKITQVQLLANSLFASLILVAVSGSQIVPVASANNLERKLKNTPVKPTTIARTNSHPRVINNPNALFEPKVSIIPSGQSATSPNTVAQQNQFLPQTSPPPASEERRVVPPVPQDPRSVPPITAPVQPQFPGRVPGVVPPFRRLNTPPVGDIAVSTFPYTPNQVDLGSNERIGRLSLQGAPAFVVLSNIARAAGLSVYPIPGEALNTPITLDVENQSVQDVFNDVLRIAGLRASRIGNRIFIGANLPLDLQNVVVRSLRLNQIPVAAAVTFLSGLGSSTNPQQQAGLLGGLQIIPEERSNSVTLIGAKNLVDFAEAQLARIDIRKRQVAVNVRVLEVRLDRTQTLGTSFAFGVLGANGGVVFNPAVPSFTVGTNNPVATPFLNLAALQSSGNLKTLTDPTLTVQEGESAVVKLVDKVLERLIVQPATGPEAAVAPPTVGTQDAGLELKINITRVDDNGFINLTVEPTVRALGRNLVNQLLAGGAGQGLVVINSISERSLTSGQIRLRDNQTLVLTGVIRDEDRNITDKVPILGDLPIVGTLFRSERTDSVRSEVVILVTPRIIDDSQNANWGYTYQPSPETQKVIDNNQITLPQNQDNRLDRLEQR